MDCTMLVAQQRSYFARGNTLKLKNRKVVLERLQQALIANEEAILQALATDLSKGSTEGYMTEIGIVRSELRHALKRMSTWSKVRRVKTPLTHWPSKSFIVPEPYGVTLIMAPWNYPFQLCMVPLIGAICAGNTAIVKPSAYASATSQVVADLIAKVFEIGHVAVVQGGRKENEQLLEQRFDYIFFTGSVAVGKLVMEKAARHLTPVTLELGGKSPVIVDSTADIPHAARRIIFGKLINAGQTCIAPDYVLVDAKVKESLITALKTEIERALPKGDLSDFPTIINAKHFRRLAAFIKDNPAISSETLDEENLRIPPILLENATFVDPIMQEEIFGPILPIITYHTLDEAIKEITSRPKPLALYVFTKDKSVMKQFIHTISFGGGCINDTIIHMVNSQMGFGGVSTSGMGSYHGKHSFDTFTHYKSMVKSSNLIDLPLRYRPYSLRKERIIKRFLR